MEFFDTHAHINFNAFKNDGDEVIRRSLDVGMRLVLPGSQIDTSRRAVEYAERWTLNLSTRGVDKLRVWAAVGLHPIHLEDMELDESEEQPLVKFHTRKEVFDRNLYEPLARNPRTVAIGEVGLDYWHRPKTTGRRKEFEEKQKTTLIQQLDLAADVKKPAILHCRVAHDDLLEIVRTHHLTKEVSPPGVVHSYTGSVEQAREFMNLGYFIGFNGIIFKLNLDEVIKFVPLDRIVLETDSPYLTPPQVKEGEPPAPLGRGEPRPAKLGGKQGEFVRNEPLNVHYVAEKIAQLKGIPIEEVSYATMENARSLFRV